MTKAYSKAAKRRAKKELPKLAEVPKKQPNGRTRRQRGQVSERREDQTALKARARHMGQPERKAGTMNHPMLECDAGRALWNSKDREDLWDTYQACRSAYEKYMRQRTGLSIYAKTAKIEMMPEKFEADPDSHTDDRTDDEKHRAAMDAWDKWKGALDRLTVAQGASIFSALHGWALLVTHSGWPTKQGEAFIEAVKALHDDVD